MKKRIRLSHKRRKMISMFLLLLLYKTILEMIYLLNISPAYSYMYLNTNINIQKFFVSLIMFIAVSIFLLNAKNGISKKIVFILHLFIYIPTISYYWMSNQSSVYSIVLSISFLLVCFVSRINFRFKQTRHKKRANTVLMIAFFVFFFFSIMLIVKRGGIDYRALSFRTIYTLRAEEKDLGTLLSYVKNWIPKVFFPLLFAYFLRSNNRILLIITVSIELLLYLSFGNKAFVLCIGWAGLCYFCAKTRNFFKSITLVLIGLFIFSFILSELNITNMLRDALPYRLIFIPSQIQYQYYDYFSINEKMYFAEGLIGKVLGLENRFGEDVAFMIGRLYSPDGGTSHSNVNVFGDAYYNLGLFGMIFISLVLGIVLSVYNAFRRVGDAFVVSSISYILFSLADTGLLTTILTGGLLLNLLLLIIICKNSKAIRSNKKVILKYNIS